MRGYWVALYKKINSAENLKNYSVQSNSYHKKVLVESH